MESTTKLYKLSAGFARHNSLPVYFVATQVTETSKAVYLYGRGTTETAQVGVCCKCGRELTHPVSIELGIGPECGKHYWNWDEVGGYTEENIERLSKLVRQDIKIDSWVPKAAIKETRETNDEVTVPSDHPKLIRKKKQASIKKEAVQVEFQTSGQPAIKITFPVDGDFKKTLTGVKTIPGRKYHGKEKPKYWTAPRSVEAVETLQELGFEMDPKLLEYLQKSKIDIEDLDEDLEIPGLKGELFPFQKKGVAFIEARDGRALVADEMGLGKTVQALAWLQKHPDKRPAVIVCPSSLKLNWKREAEKWMEDPKVQVLSGTKATQPIIGETLIINYAILKHWVDKIKEAKPQVVVGDEVHYIKNNKSQRTKAYKKLVQGIPHHIPMTGTPIVNRPVEIINAVRLVDKSVIPNVWAFKQRYCGATHNGFGWDFSGASNTEELHEKLTKTVMIRRKKKEVLKDLPDKTRSFVPMELDNEKEYQQAEQNFIRYVRNQTEVEVKQELEAKLGDLAKYASIDEEAIERLKNEKAQKASAAETLVKIGALKKIAVKGKMKQAVKWIKNFLESDEKLVVMAVHKFVIKELMDTFGDIAVKVDGSVTGEGRELAVRRFQEDPKVRLFVGNIKAAGVGLTLTAASSAAFLELPWTPGDLSQAEDRIHRIGQKENCSYYYLLAEDTIEERQAELLDEKRKVLDSVLDGIETDNNSLLSALMEQYKNL